MVAVIEARRIDLKAWDDGTEGKKELDRQFESHGLARTIAKRGKDAVEIEAAKKALDDLTEKIDGMIDDRRKDSKGWYIPMDRLYRRYNVERESFHNRKFSGEPLKVLMRNAIEIFNDAKAIIRMHKKPSVDDSVINQLCDETGATLFACHEMFLQLNISTPTEDDVENAGLKIGAFMGRYRRMRDNTLPPQGTFNGGACA
mmetsp:Transcript_904/g.1606  ORF Transcript_904/g.1606 Transcript_904/m.1606 type:complete len:201 (+) Transcript_904:249-851(+)